MTPAEITDDCFKSWRLAVAALREMAVRSGAVPPSTEEERRQCTEGDRAVRDLDCAKELAA